MSGRSVLARPAATSSTPAPSERDAGTPTTPSARRSVDRRAVAQPECRRGSADRAGRDDRLEDTQREELHDPRQRIAGRPQAGAEHRQRLDDQVRAAE